MQLKIMVLRSLLFNPIDLTPMGPITKCQYNRYKFKLLQVMWYFQTFHLENRHARYPTCQFVFLEIIFRIRLQKDT